MAAAQGQLEGREAELTQVKQELQDNELEAEKVAQMITAVQTRTRELEALRRGWEERMAKATRAVDAAEYEMEGAKFNMQRIRDHVAARTREVEDMRRALFDEACDRLVDLRKAAERSIDECRERMAAAESSIETFAADGRRARTCHGIGTCGIAPQIAERVPAPKLGTDGAALAGRGTAYGAGNAAATFRALSDLSGQHEDRGSQV